MKQTYIYGIILIIILSSCATIILIDNINKSMLLKEYRAKEAAGFFEDSNMSDDIIIDNKKIESGII